MAQTKVSVGTGTGGIGIASLALRGIISIAESAAVVDHVIENANAQAYVQEVIAVSGTTSYSIPAKAGAVVVVPLKDADISYHFKGTGNGSPGTDVHTFHPAAPFVITFPNPPLAFMYLQWTGVAWWDKDVTADNTTDKITLASHGIANGTKVYIGGLGLPTGLQPLTPYYVISSALNDFQLSLTSGGAPIDFTSNGTTVKLYTMCQYKFYWI